jgi:molecular chaperone Hsp33
MCLLQSCTQAELLDSSLLAEDLLFRLFHEEGVRIFDKKYFRHECRCSQERIKDMLSGMPKAELEALKDESGTITVTCQFCGKAYGF